MKKAFAILKVKGVDFQFHDYKKEGINRGLLEKWVSEAGWETVLNRAGTTFRGLPDKDKTDLDSTTAIELMLAQPSMIKRPVLDVDGAITIGFKPEIYQAILS